MTPEEQRKEEERKVNWYFNQGAKRPMDKYFIQYNPITFEPSLKLRVNKV